jgi:hypothetical protein
LAILLQVNGTISLTLPNSLSDHLAARQNIWCRDVDRDRRIFGFGYLRQRYLGQGL